MNPFLQQKLVLASFLYTLFSYASRLLLAHLETGAQDCVYSSWAFVVLLGVLILIKVSEKYSHKYSGARFQVS